MPTELPRLFPRLRPLAALAAAVLAQPVLAQTDDAAPFYVGGSAGISRVSNIYRQSSATNDDTVTSLGLLGGIDQRYGRQHLTLDGSLQDNRYATNSDLNNRSYSVRGALNWQTVGDLSGVLSAKSDRSLADFNIGGGVDPILKKNVERDDEYQATARLGVGTRYSLEAGWLHRRRAFSAEEYDRFIYHQNTASLGVFVTPAGNVKLGLAGRHTKGANPLYPIGIAFDTNLLRFVIVSAPNDYTRDDLDFTTRWSIGGKSTLNTRFSRSRTKNSLDDRLRDFSGTTGAIGWTWQPTSKLQLDIQYSRDTGQEGVVRTSDLNSIYSFWQLGGTYAVTGKLSLSVKASRNRVSRTSQTGAAVPDALDDNQTYNAGLRWAYSRAFSLGCQYDHVNRDSSVAQYVYSASSFGCTGQALFY